MLNRSKPKLVMGQILKDIYEDIEISSYLGFKGGTCCYFLYNLPRFSVDLDFDLLSSSEEIQDVVLARINKIISKYGVIKESLIKKNTIFFLLSYGETDHNIKVEISIRDLPLNIKDLYTINEYLGISILSAKKDYMFSTKLIALTTRKNVAMRDVFDINYFAKNYWNINTVVLESRTKKSTIEYLESCIRIIEKIKENQILSGLGDLLESEKDKNWVKTKMKSETIFLLKNYISTLK